LKSNKKISPVVILLEPQLEENIGAVARAMLNFNLHNLRIIKKKWRPNRISFKTSAKADEILKNAQVFKNLEDAINDLQFVFATSNRKRDLNTDLVNLKQGTKIINSYKNSKVGILFGPERSGLTNEHIALCDKIIEIPLNKNFKSLNLAQSVLLIAYELFNLTLSKTNFVKIKKTKKKELIIFFKVLQNYLEKGNFFKVKEKKKYMMRNVKTIFNKANLTEKEIKILLGIVKNLTKK
jgi:tRNA/rRNA methyltransferase|tara:strand:- start:169 stop:882 length:714 start_codon:yes stop_codon:yes gene_type:complete